MTGFNKTNWAKPDFGRRFIAALKEAGFQNVDCFYKYGIFSVFGGRK